MEIKNKTSNKTFGLFFSCLFLLTYFYFYINNQNYWLLLIISLIFLFSSFFFQKILTYPNKAWFYIGIFIGKTISPIIMTFIYILLFSSIGLIIKLLKKNTLDCSFEKKFKSYWVSRQTKPQPMKRQF